MCVYHSFEKLIFDSESMLKALLNYEYAGWIGDFHVNVEKIKYFTILVILPSSYLIPTNIFTVYLLNPFIMSLLLFASNMEC